MKTIILAWWSGTRLWPLSTEEHPKQFIRLFSDHSLLQETRSRMASLPGSGAQEIYISTQSTYIPLIQEHITPLLWSTFWWVSAGWDPAGTGWILAHDHIICEPSRRNTFPAFLYIARYLEHTQACQHNDVLVFCPSDHMITPAKRFHDYLLQAETYARDGQIVLFGIIPDRPETWYGYIQVAEHSNLAAFVQPITSFVEKPDLETAKTYVSRWNYFWNAGIFMISYQTLIDEIRRHVPEAWPLLDAPFEEFVTRFTELPALPIDIAIMEKTDRACVVPMLIQRSDIWSRDAVYDVLPKDNNGNVVIGNNIALHTAKNSLIYSTSWSPTLISGLDDMLSIHSDDGVFQSKRWSSQYIKTLLSSLT